MMPSVREERGKETVGATAAVLPTPTQTPTGIPTSGVTSTPTPTSTPIPEPATPAPLPVLLGKVLLTDSGAIVTEPIGMEMVRVPAAELLIRSDPAKDKQVDGFAEEPQHRGTLDEYYIGKCEVTNDQYAAFVQAAKLQAPEEWEKDCVPAGTEDHPVVNITWDNAVAFTQWLSEETGHQFRLCTGPEWEKGCRGEKRGFCSESGAFCAQRPL